MLNIKLALSVYRCAQPEFNGVRVIYPSELLNFNPAAVVPSKVTEVASAVSSAIFNLPDRVNFSVAFVVPIPTLPPLPVVNKTLEIEAVPESSRVVVGVELIPMPNEVPK